MNATAFQNTFIRLSKLSLVELRSFQKRLFRILKEARQIKDLRNFKSALFHLVGENTGASSHLYFNHARLVHFLAKVLARFGTVVRGEYSLTFNTSNV